MIQSQYISYRKINLRYIINLLCNYENRNKLPLSVVAVALLQRNKVLPNIL